MIQKIEDTLRKCPLFFRRWRNAYFLSLFYLLSCPSLHFHPLQVVEGVVGEVDIELSVFKYLGRARSAVGVHFFKCIGYAFELGGGGHRFFVIT